MTAQPDLSRADATRARLLEAAVIAFAEKGFHGTTTRDIATAAGMSPAALYVHHKSKEELLYLISKDGHQYTLRLIRQRIAPTDRPVDGGRPLGQLRTRRLGSRPPRGDQPSSTRERRLSWELEWPYSVEAPAGSEPSRP
jgi:AcrR family transcriptional regulator